MWLLAAVFAFQQLVSCAKDGNGYMSWQHQPDVSGISNDSFQDFYGSDYGLSVPSIQDESNVLPSNTSQAQVEPARGSKFSSAVSANQTVDMMQDSYPFLNRHYLDCDDYSLALSELNVGCEFYGPNEDLGEYAKKFMPQPHSLDVDARDNSASSSQQPYNSEKARRLEKLNMVLTSHGFSTENGPLATCHSILLSIADYLGTKVALEQFVIGQVDHDDPRVGEFKSFLDGNLDADYSVEFLDPLASFIEELLRNQMMMPQPEANRHISNNDRYEVPDDESQDSDYEPDAHETDKSDVVMKESEDRGSEQELSSKTLYDRNRYDKAKIVIKSLIVVFEKHALLSSLRKQHATTIMKATFLIVSKICDRHHSLSSLVNVVPSPQLTMLKCEKGFVSYLYKFIEYMRAVLPELTRENFQTLFVPLFDKVIGEHENKEELKGLLSTIKR